MFLSVRHGADSVCIGRYLGTHQIQVLSIDIGARRPLGASVSGVALLAGMAAADAKALVDVNAGRFALQRRSAASVRREVQAARRLGHVTALEGVMPGTSALAVPIHDARGAVIAAISIAALADRLERKRWPEVIAAMLTHARLVTRRHGEVERARVRGRPGNGRAAAG